MACSKQRNVIRQKVNLTDNVIVGEINDNKISVLIDEKDFIVKINKETKKNYDKLVIDDDITLGDKKSKYFYIKIYSSVQNISIVRWLKHIDGKLWMLNSKDPENYQLEDFYVSCEGTDVCFPRLFSVGNKLFWSCREDYACVSEKQYNIDKRILRTSVF